MTLTFLVSASLTLTLVLVLAAGLVALPFAIRRGTRVHGVRGWGLASLFGAGLGILLWRVAGEIGGDGFFHLARVQKLLAVRRPVARERERVPRRRAPSRLRVPALARLPGARREGGRRRAVRGGAPRAERPRALRGGARLRGGLGALPAGHARARVGAGRGRDRCDGAGLRRRVHGARAPRDRVAPAARAGGARARIEATRRPTAAVLASAAAASFVVAVVHPTYALFLVVPVYRVPGRTAPLGASRRRTGRSRARSPDAAHGRVLRVAPAGDRRHGLGQPQRARAPPWLRAVRRPARGDAGPVLRRSRALRAVGRDRGRGAAPASRSPRSPRGGAGRRMRSGARSPFRRSHSCPGSSRRSPTPSPSRSRGASRGSSRSGSRSPAGSACSPG